MGSDLQKMTIIAILGLGLAKGQAKSDLNNHFGDYMAKMTFGHFGQIWPLLGHFGQLCWPRSVIWSF